MIHPNNTFVSIIENHAAKNPNKKACIFVDAHTETALNYRQLYYRAKAIAGYLQQFNPAGERALIILPQNIDYLTAFLACLFARVIAVTAYPIVRPNIAQRIKLIAENTAPKFIIAESESVFTQQLIAENKVPVHFININDIDQTFSENYKSETIRAEDLAFLQFSSGSTGAPKGVMVTHHNLLANLEMMALGFKQNVDSVFVNWAPLFHDMGLICAALHSLYLGAQLYLMTPLSFIRNPFSWLNAISNYRASISFAPDFAFNMCANNISDEQKALLDLSCWKKAVLGSEPIRKNTIEKFSTQFSVCGFKKSSLCPAYGLAEATVYVCNSNSIEPIYDKSHDSSHEIISCGQTQLDASVSITDMTNFTALEPYQIGEVWLKGSNIAQGYWNNPEQTSAVFNAFNTQGDGPFLRTGDLGYIDNSNNLYICGRIKDVIILHGKCYAAHDLEMTIQQSNPMLAQLQTVAFSIEENNVENLIIAVGIDKTSFKHNFNQIIREIKLHLFQEYTISPYKIIFIPKNKIQKTTSGKLQRQLLKSMYKSNQLQDLNNVSLTESARV